MLLWEEPHIQSSLHPIIGDHASAMLWCGRLKINECNSHHSHSRLLILVANWKYFNLYLLTQVGCGLWKMGELEVLESWRLFGKNKMYRRIKQLETVRQANDWMFWWKLFALKSLTLVIKLSLLDFRINSLWRWMGKITPLRYFCQAFQDFFHNHKR